MARLAVLLVVAAAAAALLAAPAAAINCPSFSASDIVRAHAAPIPARAARCAAARTLTQLRLS